MARQPPVTTPELRATGERFRAIEEQLNSVATGGSGAYDPAGSAAAAEAAANAYTDAEIAGLSAAPESSGVLTGGVISIGAGGAGVATTFSITAGTGQIVDNTVSPPTVTAVSWSAQTDIAVTNILTQLITYVAIDSGGSVVQSGTDWTPVQQREYVVIGIAVHSNQTTVNAVNQTQIVAYAPGAQANDLMYGLGVFNVTGNVFTANGANRKLNKSVGSLFRRGSNYTTLSDNPHVTTTASLTQAPLRMQNQTGAGSASTTDVDVANYDVGGVTTAISPATRFSILRVFLFQSNLVAVQRGQALYLSLAEAKAAIQTENYVTNSILAANGLLRGFIVAQANTTDFTDTSKCFFIEAGRFGGSAGVGGLSVSTLQNAYDNSSSPEILTDATRLGLTVRRGSGADTDVIIEGQDGAGATTFSVTGAGKATFAVAPVFTDQSGTRTALGATTVGGNFFTLTNPGAITFPRIDAANTVTARSAADYRTDLGLGAGTANAWTTAQTMPDINISDAAATSRDLVWQTAGTGRWRMRADGSAESGGDAGSNFTWAALDDSGVSLGNVLSVVRATRVLTFTVTPKAPTAAPLTSDTSLATTEYVDDAVAAGGGSAADVQVFTAAGADVWTKPAGVTFVEVVMWGGGGGGGAGASLATATIAKGGAGGGGGAYNRRIFRASDLNGTEDLVVGAGGTAGAPGAAGAAGGNAGAGSASTFGTTVRMRAGAGSGGRGGAISAAITGGGGGGGTGGDAGAPGATVGGIGGLPGSGALIVTGAWGGTGSGGSIAATTTINAEWGGGGGAGSNSANAAGEGGGSLLGGGGGGNGGAHTVTPAVTSPTDGGASNEYAVGGGGAAGTSGAAPTAGTAGAAGNSTRGGAGGGGGGSTVQAATAGAAGGAGGSHGGGGGGGGVGMNPGLGGAGGVGGAGAIYVYSW